MSTERTEYIVQYEFQGLTGPEWKDTSVPMPTLQLADTRVDKYLRLFPEVRVQVVRRTTIEEILYESEALPPGILPERCIDCGRGFVSIVDRENHLRNERGHREWTRSNQG